MEPNPYSRLLNDQPATPKAERGDDGGLPPLAPERVGDAPAGAEATVPPGDAPGNDAAGISPLDPGRMPRAENDAETRHKSPDFADVPAGRDTSG